MIKGSHHSEETKLKMRIKREGRTPFLGYHHSVKTKMKYTEIRKGKGNSFYGKHHTVETKEKLRNAELGELNHNWKGGKTPDHKNRLDNYKWHDTVIKVKKRDNYTCQICGEKGKDVHHILSHWFLNDFNLKDLITLCRSCHNKADRKMKYVFLYLISKNLTNPD